jgi:hypothetical protein
LRNVRLLWQCAVCEQDHADKHDGDRARSRSRKGVETNANAKIQRTHFRKDYAFKDCVVWADIPPTEYWAAGDFWNVVANRRGYMAKATGLKVIRKGYSVINASVVFDEDVHLEQGLNSGVNATLS